VLIRAGDWIVCDRDGICVISAHAIETIAAGAEARIANETSARARITAGEPTRTVFDLKLAPLNAHGVRGGVRSDRDLA
jgi:regulator of RNase E activity RraA